MGRPCGALIEIFDMVPRDSFRALQPRDHSEQPHAEDRAEPLEGPLPRPTPPGLDVPDRPGIEPGPGRDLLLGEP